MTIDFSPESGHDVWHHMHDSIYAKEIHIAAGRTFAQHTHFYGHTSILASGKVEVEIEGKVQVLEAPACIEIKAHEAHSVKAIENSVWFCIHAPKNLVRHPGDVS